MVTQFVRGLIQSRFRAKAVPMFGPFDDGGEWVLSDSGQWSCAVRRVRRFVLVFPSPLVLNGGGIGYGFRRFGRYACLGMALLPLVPTHILGSCIRTIPYVGYINSKA